MTERALIITTVLVIVVFLALAAWGFHGVRVDCEQRGGELMTVYKGTLCVSSDGRILR